MADTNSSPGIHTFPRDIKDSYHFMKFSSFKYQRTSRGTLPNNPGYTGHVILPLPPNLMANYGANWGTSEFSPFQKLAVDSGFLNKVGTDIRNGGLRGTAEQYGNSAKDFIGKMSESVRNIFAKKAENDTQGSSSDKISSGMIDSFFNNVAGPMGAQALDALNDGLGGNGVSIGMGISRNPHIAVYYVQPELRTHTFAYKLSPKNQVESETAQEIIKFFKLAQAPTIIGQSGSHLFGYPDEFQITFNNEANLFKIMNCVLKDFTVNYHGQGNAAYFRDTKAPVDVEISLTFQEMGVLTRELIEQGY